MYIIIIISFNISIFINVCLQIIIFFLINEKKFIFY